MERNLRALDQDSLEADIEVGDFQVIPRPQELIKSHLRSSGAKVKKSKEKSASKEFSTRKESRSKSSIKEKSSKSMNKNRLKAAEKKQREKELDKKFELFLHSAKHAMAKHSSKSEISAKMSNLELDKQKSSAESGETIAEDQNLKIMEEPAFTAQERFKVLNARDNLIRLNIKLEETERKKVIGSCPDMCPEKERYSRIAKNCLSVLEMKMALDPKISSRDADHRYMIKEYSRSSADQQEPLPHELRPVPVLKFTMDYIICNLMDMQLDAVTIRDWYDFIWNRTRSIRKCIEKAFNYSRYSGSHCVLKHNFSDLLAENDITQQQLCDIDCVDIIEKCVRFHIHCAEAMSEEDTATFDPKINNENLTKCLQTLKHMYHDLLSRGIECPNEAEFRAYDILLSLTEGETLRLVKDIRKDVLKSPSVKFAFEAALAFKSNNYVKFFKLMEETTYLNGCIMHRYINEARAQALQIIVRAYSTPQRSTMYPISSLVKDLKFESPLDACNFCKLHGLSANERYVTLERQTFSKMSSVFPATRSKELVHKKKGSSLGKIVNNGLLPENPLAWYEPHSSFNEKGILQKDILAVGDKQKSLPVKMLDATLYQKNENVLDKHRSKVTKKKVPEAKSPLTLEAKFKSAPKTDDHLKSAEKLIKSFSSRKEQENKIQHEEVVVISSSYSPTVHNKTITSDAGMKTPLTFKETFSAMCRKSQSLPTFGVLKKSDALPERENFFTEQPLKPSSSFFNKPASTFLFPHMFELRERTPLRCDINASQTDVQQMSTSTFFKNFKSTKSCVSPEKIISVEPVDVIMDDTGDRKDEEIIEKVKDYEIVTPLHRDQSPDAEEILSNESSDANDKERALSDTAEKVYAECINDYFTEVCEEIVIEEQHRRTELEDIMENMRLELAKYVIYKWKLFCERKRQRNRFQNSVPNSPWVPMLINTEYVTAGAASPISVYKKHCSVSKLTASKLEKKNVPKPGWEYLTTENFSSMNQLPDFPAAYLCNTGVTKFFKFCLVLVKNGEDSISHFIKWMQSKFRLAEVPGSSEDVKHLSFYTLKGGKTVICISAIIIEPNVKFKPNNFTMGISAMIFCVPTAFKCPEDFCEITAQFETLLDEQKHLGSFPFYAVFLQSKQFYNAANSITSFLNLKRISENFSAMKISNSFKFSDYVKSSKEIVSVVNWLTENLENLPTIENCCLQYYLEDSYALAFNSVCWKLSLEEYESLKLMPQHVINFYNKVISSRASLLISDFLVKISQFWPPEEIFILQPSFRFIEMEVQKISQNIIEQTCLPKFQGNPNSTDDLWHYVESVANRVDVGKDMLILNIKNVLENVPQVSIWTNVISKCAYHLLCNQYSKLTNLGVNGLIYYMKEEADELNFDDFWEVSFLDWKFDCENRQKRKNLLNEEDNQIVKKPRKDLLTSDLNLMKVCQSTSNKDISACNMSTSLAALRQAIMKEEEEYNSFLHNLDESFECKNIFDDKHANFLSSTQIHTDFQEEETTCNKVSEQPRQSFLNLETTTYDEWINKSQHSSEVPTLSSITRKLSELRYNIQKNNILEDNISFLLNT